MLFADFFGTLCTDFFVICFFGWAALLCFHKEKQKKEAEQLKKQRILPPSDIPPQDGDMGLGRKVAHAAVPALVKGIVEAIFKKHR